VGSSRLFVDKRNCCPSSTGKFIVTNAFDASPLAGATISTTRRSPYMTNANGEVEIEVNKNLPYTLSYTVSKDGYTAVMGTAVFDAAGITKIIPVAMRPVPVPVDRVELHWGTTIRDLDLYIIEYDDTSNTCQTSYFNMNGCVDTSLDQDVVSGTGPEITTWTGNSRKYMIVVRQYTTATTYLVNSQAKLRLYGQDNSEQIFDIPTTPADNPDRHWVFGCFDGALGLPSLNVLNSFTATPSLVACNPLGLSGKLEDWVFNPGPEKTLTKKQLRKQHKKFNNKKHRNNKNNKY